MRVKRDIMDSPPVFDSKLEQFKYWFTNVFWFHYRGVTIGTILASALIISIIYSVATNRDPDLFVIIAAEGYMDTEYSDELRIELEQLVNEYYGIEDAKVEFTALNVAPDTEMGYAALMVLPAHFSREDMMLFIMQDILIERMVDSDDGLKSLEPYGFGDVNMADVSDGARIRKLVMNQNLTMIAGLVDRRMDNADEYTELSARALKLLSE